MITCILCNYTSVRKCIDLNGIGSAWFNCAAKAPLTKQPFTLWISRRRTTTWEPMHWRSRVRHGSITHWSWVLAGFLLAHHLCASASPKSQPLQLQPPKKHKDQWRIEVHAMSQPPTNSAFLGVNCAAIVGVERTKCQKNCGKPKLEALSHRLWWLELLPSTNFHQFP